MLAGDYRSSISVTAVSSGIAESVSKLERGFLVLAPLDSSAAPWFAEFFDQYHDQEPQLADAAIVYLAGREGIETIFTLDHRHFSVFRLPGNRPLTLLPQNR